MKLTRILLTCLSALALCSCGEKKTSTSDKSAPTTESLQSLILESAPADAQQIFEIRKAAKEGDKVVISGKVMGRKDPFVDGRAIMMIGDPNKITSCDLNHDDACPTPWDVCCDDPDVIKASTLTVQVVDTDGKLVKEGLKGLGGMKELSQLVVVGTVADGSNAENMFINATGFYIRD